MSKFDFDWKPLALVPLLAILALPLIGSGSTWLTLTVAGLAMGIWFTGISIGNFLAGLSAGLLQGFNLRNVFLISGAIPVVVGLIYFLLVPWVRTLLVDDKGPAAGAGH